MALIYCGIDEAGYGPLLGPLCAACAMFRIEEWSEGDPAPDLWRLLDGAVCRGTSDPRRRIAVDDSKKLKLANSSVRKHPLFHLERGVVAFLDSCGESGVASRGGWGTDAAFLARLGVESRGACAEPWYAGEPRTFPCGITGAEAAIGANMLRLALESAGVRVLELQAQAVGESAFNEMVEASGTKAAVTESVLVEYLSRIWERHAAIGPTDGLRVVCDRQGGRTQYAGMLKRTFPDAEVVTDAETPGASRYQVRNGTRRMVVTFKVEAESSHLPVALASMTAKLTRELFMARFNRYWSARQPELKPTAGYALDARRWLRDAQEAITPEERRTLVRRA